MISPQKRIIRCAPYYYGIHIRLKQIRRKGLHVAREKFLFIHLRKLGCHVTVRSRFRTICNTNTNVKPNQSDNQTCSMLFYTIFRCTLYYYPFSCSSPGVFLSSVIQWGGVAYGKYQYPSWGEFCGWVLALASMLWIPGVAIYKVFTTPGGSVFQRICFLLRPDQEEMKAIEVREGLATHSEMQTL